MFTHHHSNTFFISLRSSGQIFYLSWLHSVINHSLRLEVFIVLFDVFWTYELCFQYDIHTRVWWQSNFSDSQTFAFGFRKYSNRGGGTQISYWWHFCEFGVFLPPKVSVFLSRIFYAADALNTHLASISREICVRNLFCIFSCSRCVVAVVFHFQFHLSDVWKKTFHHDSAVMAFSSHFFRKKCFSNTGHNFTGCFSKVISCRFYLLQIFISKIHLSILFHH